jgi:SAM-dependent methyltransferase
MMAKLTQTIFAKRAAFYTTSAEHRDQVVLNRLVELAQVQPGHRMLDVATGTGHTAFAFAPHLQEVIATDLTAEMVTEGKKLKEKLGIRNVEFSIADVHEMPFKRESFEIVTCRRAAHHFTDLNQALREMMRVLKSGGRLTIDDRSVPEDDFADRTLNRLDTLHDRSHVREYRPSEWAGMMRDAGCKVQTVELYTKQRPLSAFTEGVESENVAEIERMIASLNEAQRCALNVAEIDGRVHLNHWFVMVAGVK